MTILLMILKIIGLTLIAILLFLLLVLLLILFAPFHYRVRGSAHESTANAHARVSWLCRLINFHISYDADGTDMYLRLFGFRKNLSKDEDDEVSQEEENASIDDAGDGEKNASDSKDNAATAPNLKKAGKERQPVSIEPDDFDHETPVQKESSDSDDGKLSSDESDTTEKDNLNQKLRRKKKAITDKTNGIKAKLRRLRRIIEDEKNKDAFSHIKKNIFAMLKCIMPGRLNLKARYSAGSPDTTAIIFGILAMFPIGYQNRWEIHPDFEAEEAYADIDLNMKGHFFFIQILLLLLGLFFDKKCRRLLRIIRRN